MTKAASIDLLQKEVLKKAQIGRLNFPETEKLADDIFQKTKQFISATTLQRFFGLVNAKTAPSDFTLDLLSIYVGYQTFDDFEIAHNQVENLFAANPHEIVFLKLSLKNQEYKSVVDFLNLLPTLGFNGKTKVSIGRELGLHQRSCGSKTQHKLLKELTKTIQGRVYFFENFVDIDHLNGYYGNGLDYYIRSLDNKCPVKFREDLIFSNSLKALSHLKVKNGKKAFQNLYQITSRFKLNSCKILDKIGSFPCGRLLFSHVAYKKLENRFNEREQKYTIQFIEDKSKTYTDFGFIFILGQVIEALHYTKKYKEIIGYYQHFKTFIDSHYQYSYSYIPLATAVEHALLQLNLTAEEVEFEKKEPLFYYEDNLAHAKTLR
ncbi:MAG: hypothetical protein ACXITV_12240 [Luteibaculaceae bacterium]